MHSSSCCWAPNLPERPQGLTSPFGCGNEAEAKSAGPFSHTQHVFLIVLATDSLENRNFSDSQRNKCPSFQFLLDRRIYDDHKEKITTNPGKKKEARRAS